MMKIAPKRSYIAARFAAFVMLALSFSLISGIANASKRVALVIGNSSYVNATPLKNPKNDAEDISRKLKTLGFDVVTGLDLDYRNMRDVIRKFSNKLQDADVSMFYYAGHALQVDGRNFLAPVSTDIRQKGDLEFETIPMDFIQSHMERETKTVLLFLDACRDNPLARSLRRGARSTGNTRGLAREETESEGTFIAFATNPGDVALDGEGRNSPFSKALLANIDRPVEISTLMTDVRKQVYNETNEQQVPWMNSSLLGRFYFNTKGLEETEKVASLDKSVAVRKDTSSDTVADTTDEPTNSNASAQKLLSMKVERLAWESVKDSDDLEELEAFVNAYGSGFFGDLARLRLERIKKAKSEKLAKVEDSRKIEVEAIRAKEKDEPQLAQKQEPSFDRRQIALQIQQKLASLGCSPGRPDGLWGKKSARALNEFARHAKIRLASTQPNPDLLDRLNDFNARICPAAVQHVKKTCPAGQRLSRKGNCYTPKVKQTKTCPPGQRLSRKGNCYTPRKKVANRQPQQQQVVRQPQQQVIVQQPQRQQVIVHQPQQQVIVQQPQRRRPGLLGSAIGGAIVGGIVNCGLLKNC